METEFVTFMSENGGPSKGYNSQHITSMDDASSEAPTIVWYLLTIKTFPSIADANHCDEVKHFLWKFIDHSDILIKISTAVLCAENCTVNEAITIIQKIKGVMLQSSQPSMLHMLHCAISKLLMITNESLKEQSNFILSVVEKRWIALFCSIKTDLRNQYKNSHPSARTSVALINVTMVNIFDSLQKINGSVSQVSAKLSGEVLSTWFKALGEYLEVDLPVEEEADQSSLRGDASGAQINIKTLLRAAVLFISANGLGVDGDAPGASKLKERASELFAIGQCIADAVSARISALPLDEIKDALVALIPALSDELYNCLRGESCDMSAVLIALQLSICSHLLVPVEGMLGKKCENAKTPILASAWISEVFGYINWLHSKLVVLSAYQSASGMSSWINCTVSESAAEPGPSSELAHWHSDRHVRFAQYCWMECSELLDCRNLGLLECCSLHMLAASCRAENRGDGSSALNNTCSRKVAVNDNASGFLHSGLSALRPSSMPELRTVFHSPRALPSTELPLLPLCLIGQAIFLSLHQDLNSRTVSSNTHNTGGVLSGFVHTFELLHSLQSLSSQAPTMVLCLLLDAACHLLREKCDEEAAHVPICAYVLQLVECVAATTRLLCLRVPDVLTVVLASPPPLGGSVPITSAATAGAENNSQPSERKKKVTFSLVERIRTHCGSLLGSAVLSHFLCSSSKQGDTEAVMAWTSDQYKVEPLRVLLVANDLSYLAGILNNYSELLVAARVNALLDCLIQCRTSTHLSVSIAQKLLRVFRKNLTGYLTTRRLGQLRAVGAPSAPPEASMIFPAGGVSYPDIELLETDILKAFPIEGTAALLRLLRRDPNCSDTSVCSYESRLQVLNRISTVSDPSLKVLVQSAHSYLRSSDELFHELFGSAEVVRVGSSGLLITPMEAACCGRKEGFIGSSASLSMARIEFVLAQHLGSISDAGCDDHPLPWANLVDVTFIVMHAVRRSVKVRRQAVVLSSRKTVGHGDNLASQYVVDEQVVRVVRSYSHLLVLPVVAALLRSCLQLLSKQEYHVHQDVLLSYVYAVLEVVRECEFPAAQVVQVVAAAVSSGVCAQLLRLHLQDSGQRTSWLCEFLCLVTSIVLGATNGGTNRGDGGNAAGNGVSPLLTLALTSPLWVLASCVSSWIGRQVGISASIVSAGEHLTSNCKAFLQCLAQMVPECTHDQNTTQVVVSLCLSGTVDACFTEVFCSMGNGKMLHLQRQPSVDFADGAGAIFMSITKLEPHKRLVEGFYLPLHSALHVIATKISAEEVTTTAFTSLASPPVPVQDDEYRGQMERTLQQVQHLAVSGLQEDDIAIRDFLQRSWEADPDKATRFFRQAALDTLLSGGVILNDLFTKDPMALGPRAAAVLLYLLREGAELVGNASCQPAAPSSPLSCLHLTVSALAEQMAILGGLSGGNKQVQAKWTLVICPRLLEISLVLQCLDYRWLVAELRTCSHSSSGALPVDPNSQEQKQVRVVNVRDVAAEHLQCLLQLIKLFRQSKESIPAHIRKHTMVVFAVMMGGVLSEASELTSDGIAQAKNHPLSSLSKNVLAYLIQSGPQAQTQVQARAPNSSGVVYELHLLCAQYSLDALPLCQYVGRVIQSSATLMQLQSQHRVFAMTAPTEVSALEQRAPHVRATDVDAECQQHSQRNSDKSNDKESSKKRHKENRLANKDQQQGGSGGGDGSAVKRSRIEESHHRQDGTSAATHPVTTPTHQTIKIEDPKQDIEVGAAHEHISRTKAASSIGDHQSTQRVAFLNKGSKGINSSSFLRALQDVPVAAVETNPSGIASTGRCQLEIHTNTLKSEDTSANLSAAISAASRDAKESGQVNPDFPSAVSAAPVNVKVETAHESKGWGLASPQQPLLSSISSSPAVSDHFQSVSRTSGNREVARIAVSKKFGAGF